MQQSSRKVGRRALLKGAALTAVAATARAQGDQTPPAEVVTTLAEVPLSSSATITVERRGEIALVGLNRPFIQNRLDPPTRARLAEVFYRYEHDPSLRALVLFGHGENFSRGIDVDAQQAALTAGRRPASAESIDPLGKSQPHRSKPVVVVVNGPAIGAGSELVGFGDVVIATPKAKFAQPEVKLGVFPPFAAVMLPQIIGQKKTYELILTGEALSAEDALRFGFVNKVVPENELKGYVESLLARISEFSGPVLEVTKRVIGSSIGRPLKEAMKTSQNLYLNELMNLEDVQEGLRAVIEKRKPVWKNK